MKQIVLGSASPRRARLLKELGIPFEIVKTDALEIADAANPVGSVVRNAIEKNKACRLICPGKTILTADTMVWFQGCLLGKPTSLDEAKAFLRSYSQCEQTVFTAIALTSPEKSEPDVRVEASLVCFKQFSEETIQRYIELVHPMDRAGAYDISDHGSMLVEKVIGSRSNVIGLPMEALHSLLSLRTLR